MEKRKRVLKTFLATIAIMLGIAFISSPANAVVSYDLDIEFSGADSPEGTPPWLRATFTDDNAGTVTLVMSDLNLTDAEWVSGWYFNLDPNLTTTDLTIVNSGGVAATTVAVNNHLVIAPFKADGGGYFDIRFDWGNGDFGVGDFSTYTITSACGACLHDTSFAFGSVGSNKGSFHTAAHVQSIGRDDQGSGWIGDSEGVIPEPSTYLLLGSGMLGLAYWRKRRNNRK